MKTITKTTTKTATLRLSKDALEAMEILKDIVKQTERFQELYSEIGKRGKEGAVELHLVGGFVIGIYSPLGKLDVSIGCVSRTASRGILKNLLERSEDQKNTSLIPFPSFSSSSSS